jgi:hypothetical protein
MATQAREDTSRIRHLLDHPWYQLLIGIASIAGFLLGVAVILFNEGVRRVRQASRPEFQEHGYEVDLVAARADRLVLATVKSFLGSRGVAAEAVTGETSDERRAGLYRLLNDPVIRDGVVKATGERYGYESNQIELRLYAGRFAGRRAGEHERRIREWAERQRVGMGSIEVVGLEEVVRKVRLAAGRKQYRDNAALVAVKVLAEAGQLVALESPDSDSA